MSLADVHSRAVVRVPDVSRVPLEKARIMLEDAGLGAITVLFQESYEDRDLVLDQRPARGQSVHQGTDVTLWVARRGLLEHLPAIYRRSDAVGRNVVREVCFLLEHITPYKRINFFKGFLTTEQDWNDAERYHVEKRKLHNRMRSTPRRGPGQRRRAAGPRAAARRPLHRGRRRLRHRRPGQRPAAREADQDHQPRRLQAAADPLHRAALLEEFADFIAYKENLDYQGHRRVIEDCKVEFSIVEPDIDVEVELARGLPGEGRQAASSDARDPSRPGPQRDRPALRARASEPGDLPVQGQRDRHRGGRRRACQDRDPDREGRSQGGSEPKAASLGDWEAVKVLPAPKPSMDLGGTTWVLVDEIEILNKESEDKHQFAIKDAKDSYRSRQKLKYPDGTVVEDTGRAQVGGYTEFRISGITPGRPLVILRRMDYVYGDYEVELLVNGKSAGNVSCAGVDRVHRWRNWPALVPAELVTEATLNIRQVASTAGRDVNMFHLWVYQPK
jgi:hypothetical protein